MTHILKKKVVSSNTSYLFSHCLHWKNIQNAKADLEKSHLSVFCCPSHSNWKNINYLHDFAKCNFSCSQCWIKVLECGENHIVWSLHSAHYTVLCVTRQTNDKPKPWMAVLIELETLASYNSCESFKDRRLKKQQENQVHFKGRWKHVSANMNP